MKNKILHIVYFVFVLLFVTISILKVNMTLYQVFRKFVQVKDDGSDLFYNHETRDCLTWKPVLNQSFEMHCKAVQCIAYAHSSPQKNQMTQNAEESIESSKERKTFFEKVNKSNNKLKMWLILRSGTSGLGWWRGTAWGRVGRGVCWGPPLPSGSKHVANTCVHHSFLEARPGRY